MNDSASIKLCVKGSVKTEGQRWPLTRGVPLPKGDSFNLKGLRLTDESGHAVSAQFRTLSRWPDNSLKWLLVDFQTSLSAGEEMTYRLHTHAKQTVDEQTNLRIEEGADQITVTTGPLRFAINRNQFNLFDEVQLGRMTTDGTFEREHEVVRTGQQSDARVRICESFIDEAGRRRIYGVGGECRASLAKDVHKVEVEEAGPLRVVIRREGAFEADIPMHHYGGYRPLRFISRLYAYAGCPFVRVLHTVIVSCDPRETEVEEISIRVPASLTGPVQYRAGLNRSNEGRLAPNQTLLMSQRLDNHYRVERIEGLEKQSVAEGDRLQGWLTVEDDRVGVGVGLRYMAEEFPKALAASGLGDGIDLYLWRDPDGKRLTFRRYAEDVAWEAGEGIYAAGIGTAKTSEFFITFYASEQRDTVPDLLKGLLRQPHVAVDPEWLAHCEALGGFATLDKAAFPAAEQMMSNFLNWARRNIELGRWYGFFDWGDMLVAWDEAENDWRFRGRWGWCNSEWDPRYAIWMQVMRTGAPDYFDLAEAMTRHSVDVDTCHYQPIRPYWVGGCFRHSVDHFGDEPVASHTFVDNWVAHYYMTGDLRSLEVLREAGEFFLRYRWSEDPTYSFSLRSMANTLRGLLYLYEVSGEARFKDQAEAVYLTIARGQNEDGSWHKRFQLSTPDRLPNQAPYGMATEGTTLAVELGTAPPFADWELGALYGQAGPLIRVVPVDQQKGYQTHYLMIGLELLHRMTGREEVAAVYRRAVDWFCGYPEPLNAAAAIQQHYGGILCRHLGYAYRLSGNRRYLDIGQELLQHLIDTQDHSDDPRRRGSVGLSPMYLSLHFFGVPYLLAVLKDAGLGEAQSS